MNGKQNGRLQRGVRINGVLTTFHDIWDGDVLIAAIQVGIQNSIARIHALSFIQSTKISGNTMNKLMSCINMATPGAIYAAVLLDWALGLKNFVLAEEIAFGFSDLNSGSGENIIHRNQLVHDRLVSNMDALIAAGYTVTMMNATSYQTLIDGYTKNVPLWREAGGLKKTATAELKLEMNNLTITLFDSLKRNLMRFKSGETSIFYGNCINSMKKVTTGTRRIYLQVIHVDGDTGTRITGVKDTLTLNGKDIPKTCSFRGVSSFYSLSNGNGSLLSVKPNYVSVSTMNLSIQDGKCLRIVVVMKIVSAVVAKVADDTVIVVEEKKRRKKVVRKVGMVSKPVVPPIEKGKGKKKGKK
jgi:hypothetical protein